jgi:predicted permease
VIDALFERKDTVKMTGLLNDLRFALRGLLRRPSFAAIAIVTLALGIGVNTAVFTLVDGVLIRPLPFDESDLLVSLEHLGREGRDELPMSQGLYLLYADQASSLEGIALFANTVMNLMADGEAERVPAQAVTPSFFEVLRVQAAMGGTFLEEEGIPDAEPVAILSDGLWRSNFGADPSVVGRTVIMSGVSRRVVGIMPPDFGHPDRSARLWVPFTIDPARAPLSAFGAGGIGRLSPNSSVEGLRSELQALISRLAELFPDSGSPAFLAEVGLRARVRPLKEAVVGDVSLTLWILLAMVGIVLLIACANVANLLLVRAEARQRELALRVAVGAGRLHVLRTFLGESLLLAGLGGAVGVAVASAAVQTSVNLIPSDLPRIGEVGMDLRVLGFTALLSLGCAIFFGLVPLLRYGMDDLAGQLRDGGGSGAGRDRHRIRNGLVVVQMALALVLLVGSGLMYRSFRALRSVDPGFEVENVLTARLRKAWDAGLMNLGIPKKYGGPGLGLIDEALVVSRGCLSREGTPTPVWR